MEVHNVTKANERIFEVMLSPNAGQTLNKMEI